MRIFFALVFAALGLTGCFPTAADQEALHYVAAIEIPAEGREDRIEIADLLTSQAKKFRGLHVDDVGEREIALCKDSEALCSDQPLNVIITIWRGDDDGQLVGSVSDLTDRRRVWATFNKGPNPEVETPFRKAALEMIMKRWPDAIALPILPGGGLPLPRDLVMTDQGYRIVRSQAEAYNLPPHSGLLAE